MAEVVLEHLTKSYDGTIAVDGIDLHIRDRELLVLVGPSGCGKSTTLRMIAGLEEITSGTIRIGPQVVNDVSPRDRNIAMVFQNYALYPHMTVRANMEFGLKMRRMKRNEIQERVNQAASILGIENLMDRKPAQLSGGQRQRVALGRAIVRRPDVFLFDEPLSNLDARLRVSMRTELVKLHRRLQTTIIYVTHDQVEAMTMGDRIVVMRDGRIQQVGTPREVYDSPVNRFVAEFLGSPPMNFIEGTVKKFGNELRFVAGKIEITLTNSQHSLAAAYVDKAIWLGVRPEDVAINSSNSQTQFDATVAVTQMLGAETVVELDADGATLAVRVAGDVSFTSGEQVRISLDITKSHLCDPTTHKMLTTLQTSEVGRLTMQQPP